MTIKKYFYNITLNTFLENIINLLTILPCTKNSITKTQYWSIFIITVFVWLFLCWNSYTWWIMQPHNECYSFQSIIYFNEKFETLKWDASLPRPLIIFLLRQTIFTIKYFSWNLLSMFVMSVWIASVPDT